MILRSLLIVATPFMNRWSVNENVLSILGALFLYHFVMFLIYIPRPAHNPYFNG